MAVQPIPQGYHSVTPYLMTQDASKAIAWYIKAFNAVEKMRMPGPDGKGVMHAEILIGNSHVMLSEEMEGYPSASPQSLGGTTVSLLIYTDHVDHLFQQAIDAGGKVMYPLQDKFWGDRMGTLTDPFGHIWSLGQHIQDLTPEQMIKAAEEEMKKSK